MKKIIIKFESINIVNSSIDICIYVYKIINEKRKKEVMIWKKIRVYYKKEGFRGEKREKGTFIIILKIENK